MGEIRFEAPDRYSGGQITGIEINNGNGFVLSPPGPGDRTQRQRHIFPSGKTNSMQAKSFAVGAHIEHPKRSQPVSVRMQRT